MKKLFVIILACARILQFDVIYFLLRVHCHKDRQAVSIVMKMVPVFSWHNLGSLPIVVSTIFDSSFI